MIKYITPKLVELQRDLQRWKRKQRRHYDQYQLAELKLISIKNTIEKEVKKSKKQTYGNAKHKNKVGNTQWLEFDTTRPHRDRKQ